MLEHFRHLKRYSVDVSTRVIVDLIQSGKRPEHIANEYNMSIGAVNSRLIPFNKLLRWLDKIYT